MHVLTFILIITIIATVALQVKGKSVIKKMLLHVIIIHYMKKWLTYVLIFFSQYIHTLRGILNKSQCSVCGIYLLACGKFLEKKT